MDCVCNSSAKLVKISDMTTYALVKEHEISLKEMVSMSYIMSF